MPPGFAFLIIKSIRNDKLESSVGSATRHMSKLGLTVMHPTLINIIHSFMVSCTDGKRPRTNLGRNTRTRMIIQNIKGLNLD